MAISIDEFKLAFAGKLSPDLVPQRDQQVTAALKELSKAVDGVSQNPAVAEEFKSALAGLVQLYGKLRKSKLPANDMLKGLDSIRQQAISKTSEVSKWIGKYATGLDIEPKYATGLDVEPKTGMAAPFAASASQNDGLSQQVKDTLVDVGTRLKTLKDANAAKGFTQEAKKLAAGLAAANAVGKKNPEKAFQALTKVGDAAAALLDSVKKAAVKEREDEQPAVDQLRREDDAGKAPPKSPKSEIEVAENRRGELKKARAAWVAVKLKAEQNLEKVKEGARQEYMADAEQFPKVVQGCKSIDEILDNLDDELRDTLDQYVSTPIKNESKLKSLAEQATEVLDRYLEFCANNPLMKAIDMKEFADVTIHEPVMKALKDLKKALA